MCMKIHHALEWSKVHDHLRSELRKLNYNHDLHRLLKNIDAMVAELSRLEVDARRTRAYTTVNAKLDQINDSIVKLDKLIVWAMMTQ